MPSENYESQEMELNLIDMFWAIMMKWRSFFAWGIIFAMLAGGVSYLKSAKDIEHAKLAKEQKIELEGEALEHAEDYLAYWRLYEKQKEYNENSIMMQLDANGFYKVQLNFYIDNKYVVEYPQLEKNNNISAYISQYTSYIDSEEFYQNLPEIAGLEDKFAYYNEIIDFQNLYGGDRNVVNSNSLLTIAIYHENKESCLAIAAQVEETIKAKKAEVTKLLGEHEVTLVSDECMLTTDSDLMEYQSRNFVAQNTQRVNMSTMEKTLTEAELAYIKQTKEEERDAMNQAGEEATEIEEAEAELVSAAPSVSKKLVVVGFLAGAVLAAGIAAIAYLFRARLVLRDDFEKLYGVKLLGNVIYDNKKKKLFGFIDKLLIRIRDCRRHYFEAEEASSMVAAGIRILAAKAGTDKVFVTGTNLEGNGKAFLKSLEELLKKDNVTIVFGNNILYDPSALEKMAETGYVVLVEEAGRSLYEEIKREVETCRYHKSELLGAVVIGNR